MKAFINKRTAKYSGGIIIVAANTAEEAQGILLAAFPDEVNMIDQDGDVCYDAAECVSKEHFNYKMENWEELFGVTAAFEIPTFIAESGHSE